MSVHRLFSCGGWKRGRNTLSGTFSEICASHQLPRLLVHGGHTGLYHPARCSYSCCTHLSKTLVPVQPFWDGSGAHIPHLLALASKGVAQAVCSLGAELFQTPDHCPSSCLHHPCCRAGLIITAPGWAGCLLPIADPRSRAQGSSPWCHPELKCPHNGISAGHCL